MKKIKIFLASSEELKQERLELADFVEHLNHTLEKVGLQVQLVKWEYLDSSMGMQHKQDDYNDALRDCEMCIVIYWTRFGMYTKTELDTAYNRLREGANPQKLYVYFKNEDENNNLTPELKEFRDSFPKEYGHFENRFSNIDTLKSQFLLQFIEYQSKALRGSPLIEVRDGKISMGGKTYVDLMNVPFVGNNEDYTELLEDIEDLREWLDEHEPDHRKYAEKAAKLREKEEKKEKMEASLWDTALDITRLSNQKCSERLQRAIDLFNKGDNKGANAILNEEEIYKDAENNINLIKLGEEGRKGLITNIEELKLKVKTLENEMTEGWLEQIIEISKKIVDYTEKVYGQDSREYVFSLHSTGNYLRTAAKYKEALAFEERALEIAERIFEKNHPDTAIAYNNIGCAYDSLGEYDKALEYKFKALKIRETIPNLNELDLASSFKDIAESFYELGDFKSSLEYSLKAINIQERNLGPYSLYTIDSYNNLGCLYSRLKNYTSSLEFLHKCLTIAEEIVSTNNPILSTYLTNLGCTYDKIGRHKEALLYKHKALDRLIKIFGINHPLTALSLNSIGFSYQQLNQFDNALQYLNKALSIRLQTLGQFHPRTAISYDYLGSTYQKMGNYKKALELKLISLKIREEKLELNCDMLMHSYYEVGSLFYILKQYESSLEYFKKAFTKSKEIGRVENMRECLNNMGKTYELIGKNKKAKEKFEEALTLLPEDHPEAEDIRTRLEELESAIQKGID